MAQLSFVVISSRTEIEEALGRQPDLSLSNLGTDMYLTLSLHAPYPLRFPDENGSRQLHSFAERCIVQENAARVIIDQTT